VIAAVFGDPTQAQAARLLLEAASIPAFFSDETVGAGLFHLATAIGGIKLQVPASRLDEALRVLDVRLPDGGEGTDWSQVDVGSPEDEGVVEAGPPATHGSGPVEVSGDDPPTLREVRAAGAFRGCVFGLFLFPFLFLACWRLGQVWTSNERLGVSLVGPGCYGRCRPPRVASAVWVSGRVSGLQTVTQLAVVAIVPRGSTIGPAGPTRVSRGLWSRRSVSPTEIDSRDSPPYPGAVILSLPVRHPAGRDRTLIWRFLFVRCRVGAAGG
jgi:hypothetical protein